MAAIKEAHKMDYIMETVGLRKAYKDNIVVDDVNMHISKKRAKCLHNSIYPLIFAPRLRE